MTSIGNKIKKVRELRNFTQEYMAKKLDMSLTGYGNLERDESDISFSRLEKISAVLGMRVEDLVSFDERIVFNINNNTNQNSGYIVQHIISPEIQKLYEVQFELLNKRISELEEKLKKYLSTR